MYKRQHIDRLTKYRVADAEIPRVWQDQPSRSYPSCQEDDTTVEVEQQVSKSPKVSNKRLSGHSANRDEPEAGPDEFKRRQIDVSACDTHSNPDQSVKRSIRSRKKPAYLGNYVCSIKRGPINPKSNAKKKKARYVKTREKLFSTSEDTLPSEDLPSRLALFCTSLLPDAFTLYTDSQTVTELTNGPVLTNTDDAVRCVNADKSVSGCRSIIMPGQRRCEFCYKFMVSENGLRRHLLLHHRRVYMRYGEPYYVVDDDEYAERCARMRHNQSHRRAAARRRETATGSVSAGMGPWPAQNNRGTMTPQNRQKTATHQQPSRAARGNPAANFPLPVASPTSQLSTFGWTPKPKKRDKPYSSKVRVPYPSHAGLQFDQFIKAKKYGADLGAYQRQCARD